MNTLLKTSQIVRSETTDLPCRVGRFLGGGGQGEVYQAEWAGTEVAVKWYFKAQATQQHRDALQRLVALGSPDDRFLWPIDIVSSPDKQGFGYIMPLREPHYRSIVDLMRRRAEPSFHALCTTGFELANGFLQLHSKGFCYRDISFGNVFFDPETGAVRICDNDNVTINGSSHIGILGTPRFMAPEVVRGETLPSIGTDLYSLAVLLFYLLMVHHPLEGKRELAIKCLDLPAMNRLYGEKPLFIFDSEDHSNAPVPCYHDNALIFWQFYPQFIRNLFHQSFTDGLREPTRRVREGEWRAAMSQLRDSIVYCKCGKEYFYCPDTMQAMGGKAGLCWDCNNEVHIPPFLQLGRRVVMLNHDTKLYPHHLDESCLYDFSVPQAQMNQNPNNPNIWGLRNLSQNIWQYTAADGIPRPVLPERSVPLSVGTRIDFGKIEGEINW